MIGQEIINPIEGIDEIGVHDYQCDCGYSLSCAIDEFELPKKGLFRIFINNNPTSETYLEAIDRCPGCGINLYTLE